MSLFGAVALSAVWWVPQLWRVLIQREASGVSAWTWAISACMTGAWTIWAASEGTAAVAVVQLVQTIGALAVVFTLRKAPTLIFSFLAFAVLSAAVVLSGGAFVGWLAVLLAFTMRLPQLAVVWASRRFGSSSTSGVSLPTWILGVISSALWVVWGFMADAPQMIAGAGVGVIMSILIVVGTRAKQQPNPDKNKEK